MIVRRERIKMDFLRPSLIYRFLFLFFIHLPNVTTSQSVMRNCFAKYQAIPCTKNDQMTIDCIVNSINDSWDPLDIRTKLTIKVNAMKSTRDKFCAEWPKVENVSKACADNKMQCSSQGIKTIDICGRNIARCNYLKYAACRIKAGMIQGRSFHDIKSRLCLETDLNRGLVPYYGPHLQCYGKSIEYPTDITFPLDHYLLFCHQFNYNQLKKCIEAKLAPVSRDELLSNKGQYISAAKSFLQKTNNFCGALSKIDNSFLTKCRMKNVLICMKEAFNQSRVGRDDHHHHHGYIPCLSREYTKCHAPIGDLVERFLTGKEISSGFTIISPSYLMLFLFTLFSVVIRS